MPRLTIDDLVKIREKARNAALLQKGKTRARITIHMGTCGLASGAGNVMDALLKEIERQNLKDVTVTSSGCAGLCSREPMATVELAGKPPVKYVDLSGDKIIRILNEHVLEGNIVMDYVLAVGCERTA